MSCGEHGEAAASLARQLGQQRERIFVSLGPQDGPKHGRGAINMALGAVEVASHGPFHPISHC